ncbi:SAM dependent carboxyl methyltransferase [Corchorus capsularis]|uniref:SAM dependent carboxyl methyltransferase n=1 Tax=Corchorus capsularis TaxID=210143 RepID=A0A1R3JVS4_COCAP|nr:SAM dependent carboxyl methyltransferase [Corchorus capsularis]
MATTVVSNSVAKRSGDEIPTAVNSSKPTPVIGGHGSNSYSNNSSYQGTVNEAEIDAFNLPIYACPPGEFIKGVEENGFFNVEVIELMNPAPWLKGPIDIPVFVKHVRAAMEGMFRSHFSSEAIDELFEQLVVKLSEISDQMESCYRDGLQLLAILKRK